jgi:hypothetical protein
MLFQFNRNPLVSTNLQPGGRKIHAANLQTSFWEQCGGESAADSNIKQVLTGLDKFIT